MATKTVTLQFDADSAALEQTIKSVASGLNSLGATVRSINTEGKEGLGSLIKSWGALNQAVEGVERAIGYASRVAVQFYQQFLGQNVQIQELILGTATSIASTNYLLLKDGLLTQGQESIEMLKGPVAEALVYIEEKSLELVGVTSKEIIPLLQITSQHLGKMNGDIKTAADLSIKFAAALGTLGIPMHQARQEMNSILQAQITSDSMLAKTLGLNNEMVRTWIQQGTLVEELNKKLQTFQDGNALAAKTMGGVTSNIIEFLDKFTKTVGEPILDPVVEVITEIYNLIIENKEVILEIAEIVGTTLANAVKLVHDYAVPLGIAVAGIAASLRASAIATLITTLPTIKTMVVALTGKVKALGVAVNGALGPIGWLTLGLSALLAGVVATTEAIVQHQEAQANLASRNQFIEVIGKINAGIPATKEELEKLTATLKKQQETGELNNHEYEVYMRVVAEATKRNEKLTLTIQSVNHLTQESAAAALAYKETLKELTQARTNDELEMKRALSKGELNEADYRRKKAFRDLTFATENLAAKQAHLDRLLEEEAAYLKTGLERDAEHTKRIAETLAERNKLEIDYLNKLGAVREEESKKGIKQLKDQERSWKSYIDVITAYMQRISEAYKAELEELDRAKDLQSAQLDFLEKQVGYWKMLMTFRAEDRKEQIDGIKETRDKALAAHDERIAKLKEEGGSRREIAKAERDREAALNKHNKEIQKLEKKNFQDLQVRQAVERQALDERQKAAKAALQVEEQIAVVKQKQLILENQRAVVQAKLDQIRTQTQIREAELQPAEKRDPLQIKLLQEQLRLQGESMEILLSQGEAYKGQFKSIQDLYSLKKRTQELEFATQDKQMGREQEKAMRDQGRTIATLNPQQRHSRVIHSRPGARYNPGDPTRQTIDADAQEILKLSRKENDAIAKNMADQVASATALNEQLEISLKRFQAIDKINQGSRWMDETLGRIPAISSPSASRPPGLAIPGSQQAATEIKVALAEQRQALVSELQSQNQLLAEAIGSQTEALIQGFGDKLAPLGSLLGETKQGVVILQQLALVAREILLRPANSEARFGQSPLKTWDLMIQGLGR